MNRVNKSIISAIIVFICILGISIVYAASTGQLTIGGTALFLLPGDVDLIIVDAGFSDLSPARIEATFQESVVVPMITDRKMMQITVDLLYPMDKRIIVFKIQNIENIKAGLESLQITDEPDITTSGVKITWPELDGVVLLPGETSAEFEIIIEWDLDYYDIGNVGEHVFSASIAYYQVQ